jgi:TRAP-type C4-dicarboxylate transport system substrate-binding protein
MMRALLAGFLFVSTGHAEPRVVRMAAIAPDGTSWARDLKALAREIETGSHGELRMKWYLGGIAGDELTAIERVRKKQLDGVGGAIFCQSLAPSLRATNLPGLFHSRDEALYTAGRMRSIIEEEMRKNGFAFLGLGAFGFDIILSHKPVRSLSDLRAGRFWAWNENPLWKVMLDELKVRHIDSSVVDASRVIEEKKLDGMIVFPSAALAYQWSTQMQYYTNLPTAFMPACLVMSNATFDSLPLAQQQLIRETSAKFFSRFNDMSRLMDDALLSGLFEKQGLKRVEPSAAFREEFVAATTKARGQIPESLITKDTLKKVLEWQADFRRERHSSRESSR